MRDKIKIGDVVIVLELGNYKREAQEPVPFKGEVIEKYEHEMIIKSLATGKEWELYDSQILETFDDAEIGSMFDPRKYGAQEMRQYKIVPMSVEELKEHYDKV